MNLFLWKYLSILLLGVFLSAESTDTIPSQTCGFKDSSIGFVNEDLLLSGQLETTGAEVVIGTRETENVENVLCNSTYITTRLENGTLSFITTPAFSKYGDEYHENSLRIPIVLVCNEGVTQNVNVVIPLMDENTSPPLFEKSSYTVELSLPWPARLPINFEQPILIRDKDFSELNANVSVVTSHRFIRAETKKIHVESTNNATQTDYAHTYKVQLYLQSEFEGGEYMVLLTADDNVFNEYATLVLKMTKSDMLLEAEKFCRLVKSPIT